MNRAVSFGFLGDDVSMYEYQPRAEMRNTMRLNLETWSRFKGAIRKVELSVGIVHVTFIFFL
jgi:hypothetical protein